MPDQGGQAPTFPLRLPLSDSQILTDFSECKQPLPWAEAFIWLHRESDRQAGTKNMDDSQAEPVSHNAETTQLIKPGSQAWVR